ncbi:DEAD/DEAH box helicase family protein [Conexibacter sp. S30A1]|uniref:DEAD/DEAH box helicase family protein n=1 Tax=Conexibacter sp. S30A1 TaxID=2937800 RepID=UPI00200CE31A|nr:DEAD/DEAH box helicase family protein [Conexibacter sp. S30A1]
MAVELKFDANQQYQRDAIDSVVELFAGQQAAGDSGGAVPLSGDAGLLHDELALEGFHEIVFGNVLSLGASTLEANLRRIQDGDAVDDSGELIPRIPLDLRVAVEPTEVPADFSVEMETGTGKTYVYLRTIAELHQRYGFAKFVIVVPSVAIREGVLSNFRLLKDHSGFAVHRPAAAHACWTWLISWVVGVRACSG